MISFGNRNFMQPMERFSTHLKYLDFFSFKFCVGVEGGRIFFIFLLFPTCSSQVPNGFISNSQYVLRFPMCSQQHLVLIPYVQPKIFPFSPIQVGQRERHSIFSQNLLFWGASIVSTFFCMCQSHWLIATKKIGLVRHSQLINMK